STTRTFSSRRVMLRSARYRHDAVLPSEHPRERELCGSAALVRGDLANRVDELEIASKVLALEARVLAAPVIGCEIVDAANRAREEATAEGTVGDEADTELRAERQQLVLRVAAPQRILGLKSADGVHRVRAADRGRRRFGQAEVAYLAFTHEIGHCADRVLDRRLRVDAMLIIEIDHVHAEAFQARVASLLHVLGSAVDTEESTVRSAHVTEFRREHDGFSAVANRAADELLVPAHAV